MKLSMVALGVTCVLSGCCLSGSDCGEPADIGAAFSGSTDGTDEPADGNGQSTGGEEPVAGGSGNTDSGGGGNSTDGSGSGGETPVDGGSGNTDSGTDTSGGATDSGEGSGTTDGGSTNGQTGDNTPVFSPDRCPPWSRQIAVRNDLPVCEMTSDNMSEDRTLESEYVWYLSGHVAVGSAKYKETAVLDHTNVYDLREHSVTLTIRAGTTIVGDDSSLLVIARGAKINAVGTAQAPIIFEGIDDGVDGTSEWGGVVILGLAPSNECPIDGGYCNNSNHGLGNSGGNDANDNSGRLSYVVIAETGQRLELENATDGLGLFSVGSGTSIDYLQVHNSGDDGISVNGGAPFMKHIVISDFFDDGLDWSDGYQGGVQYMLLHSQSLNDRGIEANNSSSDNYFDEPMSMPTITNSTIVSRLASESSYGIFLSSGSGVFLSKSLFSNYDTCMRVSADSTARISEGRTSFNNVALNCRISTDSLIDPGGYTSTDIEYSRLAPIGARFSLVNKTETTLGALGVAGVQPGLMAPEDFFEATNYLGAVDPDSTERWWDGWTIEFYDEGL